MKIINKENLNIIPEHLRDYALEVILTSHPYYLVWDEKFFRQYGGFVMYEKEIPYNQDERIQAERKGKAERSKYFDIAYSTPAASEKELADKCQLIGMPFFFDLKLEKKII